MTLKLVGADEPEPVKLSDIPAMLRTLADAIHAMADPPVTALCVTMDAQGEVVVYCFGDNPSKAEVVGTLVLASRQFTPEAGETRRGNHD